MKVLAISYAKRTLESGSREQKRMKEYAQTLDSFTLVVLTRRKDGLPEQFEDGNLHVYATHARTRVGMLFQAFFISSRLITRSERKDWTVSSQDPFETSVVAYCVSRLRGVRLHVQVHGDPYGEASIFNQNWFQRMRFLWMLFVLKRAAKVRVVSQRVASSLKVRGVSLQKIAVLPVRPDLQPFLEVGKQRAWDSEDVVTFLYVGRFVEDKNIDVIIEAFARVYKKHKNVQLHLLGDGPLKKVLYEQVRQLSLVDLVTFIPWTNTVAKEMAAADIFVFMSAHEGYGLVLLEAMATGLPVITTDVGCVGELMYDQKEVLIVAPEVSVCVTAMETMVTSPKKRTELGAAGLRVAERETAENVLYTQRWRDSF